jgi:molybdenum cofactor cytidylyltransferase
MTRSDGREIAAVILAAGASRRLGQPKQLLPCRGKTLLGCVIDAAMGSRVKTTMLIVGAHRELLEPIFAGLPIQVVTNEKWEEGVASSIRAGIAALGAFVGAAILLVSDQPDVSASLINRLIMSHETGKPIVASEYGGSLGVPALFDRAFFGELSNLRGDHGAKSVILRHLQDVGRVGFPGGMADVDTLDDLPGR